MAVEFHYEDLAYEENAPHIQKSLFYFNILKFKTHVVKSLNDLYVKFN